MSFWTTCLLALLTPVNFITATNVIAVFQKYEIIPNLIYARDIVPLKVSYGDSKVNLGNELTPTQVIDSPTVTWKYDFNDYYLLAMINPDFPSRTNQSLAQGLHWLVGNILDNHISNADTIVEYVGSGPPLGSGLLRYIFFLFRQPGKLTFDEPRLKVNGTGMLRTRFSIRRFAEKYYLGQPKAGNFFFARYDYSVNDTLARLGL